MYSPLPVYFLYFLFDELRDELVICRNKSFENVITIDLHGQHVKPAMKLLKLQLVMVSYAQCKHLLDPVLFMCVSVCFALFSYYSLCSILTVLGTS